MMTHETRLSSPAFEKVKNVAFYTKTSSNISHDMYEASENQDIHQRLGVQTHNPVGI